MLLLVPISKTFRLGSLPDTCFDPSHSHQRSQSLALYFVVLLPVLMSEEVRSSHAVRKKHRRQQRSIDRHVEACISEDHLIGHDDEVEKVFDSSVRLGVESILGRCRTVNEYLNGQPRLREEHPVLADATLVVGSEVWTLWRNVKSFGKRIAGLSVRVNQKVHETRDTRMQKGMKGKSIKRQEAGKKKAGPLRSWNCDVEEARSALKRAGYKGSLALKKGSVLYAKVEAIRQDKFDQVRIGEPTSVSSK